MGSLSLYCALLLVLLVLFTCTKQYILQTLYVVSDNFPSVLYYYMLLLYYYMMAITAKN